MAASLHPLMRQSTVPDRERTKLSLSVLGAAAILLCAAIALVALIAGPNPAGSGPDAIATDAKPTAPAAAAKLEASSTKQAKAERAPPVMPAPEPVSTPPDRAPSPVAVNDPAATGALQEHASSATSTEPAPFESGSDEHGIGVMPTPEPHQDSAATAAEPPGHASDAAATAITQSPVGASPAIESSPTQSRADEPTMDVASAEPPTMAEAHEAPILSTSPLETSSTQTQEQPAPPEPRVEWSEPAARAPLSIEQAAPQIVAEAQPTPAAQPVTAPVPLPRRVEKPKEVATAEPVQSRIKAKPMMVGTGGVVAKPVAPRRSGSVGAYSSAVRSAIGRNKATVAGRGSATVTFAIGPGGGLRGAKITKSSGNQALDQAALASVRRAGPFPAPPAGAKSTYSIQIYFR